MVCLSICRAAARQVRMVIVKNSSPPPTVGKQFTDRSPTGYQQVADSRQKYSREKYSTETYVKTNKTYQKRRTAYRKSRGLDKHGKKPSSEDQALEKDVWIKM